GGRIPKAQTHSHALPWTAGIRSLSRTPYGRLAWPYRGTALRDRSLFDARGARGIQLWPRTEADRASARGRRRAPGFVRASLWIFLRAAVVLDGIGALKIVFLWLCGTSCWTGHD